MIKEYYKYPRLFLKMPLAEKATCPLASDQAHYVRNVMRMREGDIVRVFNGQHGEFFGNVSLIGKRGVSVILGEQRCKQQESGAELHLYFAPIKKQRLDMLIEKAVELGVSHLHPILTNRTENRKLNTERLESQIMEATEQSERLTIPRLYEIKTLREALKEPRAYALNICIERGDAKPLSQVQFAEEAGFLIGPEGGFDDGEIAEISKTSGIVPVSLGQNVLRAETAALACLAYTQLSKQS